MQASSKQMYADFLKNLPSLTPDKVVVIREGVNVAVYTQSSADDSITARHGLPKDFLFYPAQLWQHKNHITILKALLHLKRQGIVIPLVLTGAKYSGAQPLFDFIDQNDLSGQVFHIGLVPYEDIIALHRVARFLITASLFESSSLPILEAAAARNCHHCQQDAVARGTCFRPADADVRAVGRCGLGRPFGNRLER